MKQTNLATKLLLLIFVMLGGYFGLFKGEAPSITPSPGEASAPTQAGAARASADGRRLQQAFVNRQSDLQVQIEGRVERLLPDDRDGSRHQRFILRLDTGQTLLVAHNIDLAPRVEGLTAGDPVALYGEYEWNERGGVIHWTHRDPQGRHADGWIRHRGRLYQ